MKRLHNESLTPPPTVHGYRILADSNGFRDDAAIAAKLAALWQRPISANLRAFIAGCMARGAAARDVERAAD